MKDSFSKKEAIEILTRALTVGEKEKDAKKPLNSLDIHDLEMLADEVGVSREELQKAVTEVTQTKEHKRDELYPEVITARWVEGRLTEREIEDFFSELKLEFGSITNMWTGKSSEIQKMGNSWEYQLKNSSVLLNEMEDGYQLRVIKQQFFHGNNLEALLIALPLAFIIGLLPVAAALEWSSVFAAFFAGAISYIASFSLVKKFTQKMRSKTLTKLRDITEFAETRLKDLVSTRQPHSESIPIESRQTITTEKKSDQNKKIQS